MTMGFSQMASASDAQGHTDVRIVQVVGLQMLKIVDAVLFGAAAQFLEVSIEALDLGEEADVETIPIQDAHRVVRIGGGDQPVAGRADSFQVPWRDESCDAGDGEVFHSDPTPQDD